MRPYIERTGEGAGIVGYDERRGFRYEWERNYRVFGWWFTLRRHGKAAQRAHARLMADVQPDLWGGL